MSVTLAPYDSIMDVVSLSSQSCDTIIGKRSVDGRSLTAYFCESETTEPDQLIEVVLNGSRAIAREHQHGNVVLGLGVHAHVVVV